MNNVISGIKYKAQISTRLQHLSVTRVALKSFPVSSGTLTLVKRSQLNMNFCVSKQHNCQ